MTAYNNILFALRHTRKGLTRDEEGRIADELLENVGMAEAKNKHPYQMSGGMRQRVAIARALAMDRDILLLDEPFGALDSKIRGELQNLLEELWCSDKERGRTAIFVTHDTSEAVRMADRIIVMDHGKVINEIEVPLRRPRVIMSLEEERMMKDLRLQLSDIMLNDTGDRGKTCRCGGPV